MKARASKFFGECARIRRNHANSNSKIGEKHRVAVLFDAENIPVSHLMDIFRYAKTFGTVVSVRVYAPMSIMEGPAFAKASKTCGFKAIVCNGAVWGKNSVDIRLVVDAMEFAQDAIYDDLVLVSSDADYRPPDIGAAQAQHMRPWYWLRRGKREIFQIV